MSMRVTGYRAMALRTAAGLAALALALGCGETLKDTYSIEITGPADAFVGATTVNLLVSGKVVATVPAGGAAPFTLDAPDFDPSTTHMTILAVRADDAAGKVVAFGETPQMEVLKLSPRIRIFVQKPGTVARGPDLQIKTKDHVAVPVESGAVGELSIPVTVPVFGAGRMWVPAGPNSEQELLSNELYVYNPITHRQDRIGATSGGLRAEAAAVARGERLYVFGGLSQSNIMEPPRVTSQLDLFAVGRQQFSSFFALAGRPLEGGEGSPRKRTVLAVTPGPVFAFGGLDSLDQPLDSVVEIDEVQAQSPVVVLPLKMATSRVGHTATLVSTGDPRGNILVYGGAPAGQKVAELFDPMKKVWIPIDESAAGDGTGAAASPGEPGHPGTGRRDHVALNLPATPENRLLILGGRGDDDQPRTDSILYYPGRRRFEPWTLTLHTPRIGFVAFVINDDLVVAGGYGSDGKLLEKAEIYDIKTGRLVSEIAALPRARASATSLPNSSVVILGGETAGSASNAVEIYQPRR
jgi:hypothetical protein